MDEDKRRPSGSRGSPAADRSDDRSSTGPTVADPLPEGCGAVRGIDARFQTNPATGTALLQIPIASARGRATPALPRWLSRRRRLRRIHPFGLEDVVAVQDEIGYFDDREIDGFHVRHYRPIEDAFVRVERWTESGSGVSHWRSATRDNVTSIFGRSTGARIVDPADHGLIFSWLLQETHDDHGNIVRCEYKSEDGVVRRYEADRVRQSPGSAALVALRGLPC